MGGCPATSAAPRPQAGGADDHNERLSPYRLDQTEILEIVDPPTVCVHRDTKSHPRPHEPVGSTTTIGGGMYRKRALCPPPDGRLMAERPSSPTRSCSSPHLHPAGHGRATAHGPHRKPLLGRTGQGQSSLLPAETTRPWRAMLHTDYKEFHIRRPQSGVSRSPAWTPRPPHGGRRSSCPPWRSVTKQRPGTPWCMMRSPMCCWRYLAPRMWGRGHHGRPSGLRGRKTRLLPKIWSRKKQVIPTLSHCGLICPSKQQKTRRAGSLPTAGLCVFLCRSCHIM